MENCCGRRATYYFLLVDPEIRSLQQEQTPPCLCVTISNEYIDECITLIWRIYRSQDKQDVVCTLSALRLTHSFVACDEMSLKYTFNRTYYTLFSILLMMIYTHMNVHYFQEWAAHWATGCSFEPQLDVKLGRTSAALTRCLLETGKLHHNMDNARASGPVPLALQQHQCKLLTIKQLNVAQTLG